MKKRRKANKKETRRYKVKIRKGDIKYNIEA